MKRAQARLSARKTKPESSPGIAGQVMEVFSSRRAGQKNAGKQGPAKKGLAGVIAAAGIGATALMRRQRARKAATTSVEPPAHSVQPEPDAAAPQRPDGPRPEPSVDQ
jgi:hypothetical protein